MWELDHKYDWVPKNWKLKNSKLRYWRRLLKVPWTAKRSNHSILKEISPEYSLEELTLKLKLQSFGYLMRRTGKDHDAGKDWRQEEKEMTEDETVGWHHRLDGHEFEKALGIGWWTWKSGLLKSKGLQRVRHNWGLNNKWCSHNWLTTKSTCSMVFII